MFNVKNNLFDFVNWVQEEMQAKNISQADIARTGYVKAAAVSMFFTYKTKSVGIDMCRAIASALNIPLAAVYSKAGILPPELDKTSTRVQRLMGVAQQAHEEDIDLAIDMLEAAYRRREQRAALKSAK